MNKENKHKEIDNIDQILDYAKSHLNYAKQMEYCSVFKGHIESAEFRIEQALSEIRFLQKKGIGC